MTKLTDTKPDPFHGYRFLSPGRVAELTSFSRSQLVLMAQRGEFPIPVQLSRGRVGFLETEVLDWLRQRQTQRAVGANWQPKGQSEAGATA